MIPYRPETPRALSEKIAETSEILIGDPWPKYFTKPITEFNGLISVSRKSTGILPEEAKDGAQAGRAVIPEPIA